MTVVFVFFFYSSLTIYVCIFLDLFNRLYMSLIILSEWLYTVLFIVFVNILYTCNYVLYMNETEINKNKKEQWNFTPFAVVIFPTQGSPDFAKILPKIAIRIGVYLTLISFFGIRNVKKTSCRSNKK